MDNTMKFGIFVITSIFVMSLTAVYLQSTSNADCNEAHVAEIKALSTGDRGQMKSAESYRRASCKTAAVVGGVLIGK